MFNPNENNDQRVKQYLSGSLKAASHPVRRKILKQLRNGNSLSSTELTDILNIDRYNLYHHLNILEKYSLIQKDNEKSVGKKIFYKMYMPKNPLMAAFSFNKQEIKENKNLIEKLLDTLVDIENFEIPNRNKISMIEINISYNNKEN